MGFEDEQLRSHGLWGVSAPPGPETPALSDAISVDVAIIGAGFTGCSAALYAAQAGASVAVIEARDVGFGAAGRNVGLVNAGLWIMPDAVPAALGADRGERLLKQLGDAPGLVFDLIAEHGIACEPVRSGTLHCATNRSGVASLRERLRQWSSRGAPVELLVGQQAAYLTGSEAFPAVLLDRRAGTIQPLAYVRGLATAAIQHGARIFTRSPALSCQKTRGGWRIATAHGSVTARRVIVATDAYSTDPWGRLGQEQIFLPYFNLATGPLEPEVRAHILPECQGAWDTKSVLSSFRLDAAGRLIFGSVGALRRGGTRIHTQWARRELARLFPELRAVEFEYGWYGTIGMTGDAIPRLHVLDDGIVSISGYNGRGIAPGTSFGRDLARLMLDELVLQDLVLPVSPLNAAPFGALRGAAYEAGAQLVHLTGSRF